MLHVNYTLKIVERKKGCNPVYLLRYRVDGSQTIQSKRYSAATKECAKGYASYLIGCEQSVLTSKVVLWRGNV
jgi:hypothetical protein